MDDNVEKDCKLCQNENSAQNTKPELKICGIRRLQDVEMINVYKPDYAGFVFAESKRRVSPEEVVRMSASLDVSIRKVGIFVNETIENIVKIVTAAALDCVQLHGEESPDYCRCLKEALEVCIWKAFRVKDTDTLKELGKYAFTDRFVLDAFSNASYGGTGAAFEWRQVSDSLNILEIDRSKLIIAGGLSVSNLTEAVTILKPGGVDVSSGVEKEGYKDSGLIRDFVKLARAL